jgi:hypothetical protein
MNSDTNKIIQTEWRKGKREMSGSNFGLDVYYPDLCSSWFSSAFSNKCRDNTSIYFTVVSYRVLSYSFTTQPNFQLNIFWHNVNIVIQSSENEKNQLLQPYWNSFQYFISIFHITKYSVVWGSVANSWCGNAYENTLHFLLHFAQCRSKGEITSLEKASKNQMETVASECIYFLTIYI